MDTMPQDMKDCVLFNSPSPFNFFDLFCVFNLGVLCKLYVTMICLEYAVEKDRREGLI